MSTELYIVIGVVVVIAGFVGIMIISDIFPLVYK